MEHETMFWFSLLLLMILVAAAPGIGMFIESRRSMAAGPEVGEAQAGEGPRPIA